MRAQDITVGGVYAYSTEPKDSPHGRPRPVRVVGITLVDTTDRWGIPTGRKHMVLDIERTPDTEGDVPSRVDPRRLWRTWDEQEPLNAAREARSARYAAAREAKHRDMLAARDRLAGMLPADSPARGKIERLRYDPWHPSMSSSWSVEELLRLVDDAVATLGGSGSER